MAAPLPFSPYPPQGPVSSPQQWPQPSPAQGAALALPQGLYPYPSPWAGRTGGAGLGSLPMLPPRTAGIGALGSTSGRMQRPGPGALGSQQNGGMVGGPIGEPGRWQTQQASMPYGSSATTSGTDPLMSQRSRTTQSTQLGGWSPQYGPTPQQIAARQAFAARRDPYADQRAGQDVPDGPPGWGPGNPIFDGQRDYSERIQSINAFASGGITGSVWGG